LQNQSLRFVGPAGVALCAEPLVVLDAGEIFVTGARAARVFVDQSSKTHVQDGTATASSTAHFALFSLTHDQDANAKDESVDQDKQAAWAGILREHWQPQADPGAHGRAERVCTSKHVQNKTHSADGTDRPGAC
jgi:hypothetical protein